jgi:hypothetical protein
MRTECTTLPRDDADALLRQATALAAVLVARPDLRDELMRILRDLTADYMAASDAWRAAHERRRHLRPYDLVILETRPDWCRDSHRAARNWGVYPHNGATRSLVTRDQAEMYVAEDPDGYARIVRDATPADVEADEAEVQS